MTGDLPREAGAILPTEEAPGAAGQLHREALGRIPLEEAEILRYALLPAQAPRPEALPLAETLRAAEAANLCCRAVWRRFPLRFLPDAVDLGFARTGSLALRKRLSGCEEALLFCCTAGAEMDRLIAREKLRSPVRGLLMNAVGAQQVEGACDLLCRRLAQTFADRELRERYSPGYGDLPLALQREVFAALDPGRSLGVYLSDSLLMIPSKSVTAIIGMKARKEP